MGRNILVSEAMGQFVEDFPVEIVERKGIGHPDSLCDGIAERISREYTRWCEQNLGGCYITTLTRCNWWQARSMCALAAAR